MTSNKAFNDKTRDALYLAVAMFIALTTAGTLSAMISQDNYDNDAYSANIYGSVRFSEDKEFMKAEQDMNSADAGINNDIQGLEDSLSAQ